MNSKFLVIGVQRFDGMLDGKNYHNGKIRYLATVETKDTNKGITQGYLKCSYELFDKFSVFPAVYECELFPVGTEFHVSSVKLVGEQLKFPLLTSEVK